TSAVNESTELKHEVEALKGQLAAANPYAERCKTSTRQAKEAYLAIRAEVEELERKMDDLQEERERRASGELESGLPEEAASVPVVVPPSLADLIIERLGGPRSPIGRMAIDHGGVLRWCKLHGLRNIIVRPLSPFVPLPLSYKGLHSLTETRYPKRRPGFTSRKKQASFSFSSFKYYCNVQIFILIFWAGPYALVQHTPEEPNKPNEASAKNRNANEKKRIAQRKAFIKSEAKKQKVLVQEAKKKKRNLRIERKMAAVARDRAWAQRLAELQKLEAEKANTA
ncbi:hypothetical protein IFM89_033215, partial [Coptis chinensis]